MGNFTISEKLLKAFQKQGIEPCPLKTATASEFYHAIGQAKIHNSHGAFVTQHSIEEYEEMRLFLTLDGMAGIAITKDNNIVSIFNGGGKRGVLKTLLPIAIENGGRKLDNYNSKKLSAMYSLYGFNPISKTRFREEFAPEDWNFERDGEPDIIFWIHSGDSAEDVVLNFGKYEIFWDYIFEFNTYDEAEDYRNQLFNKIYNDDDDDNQNIESESKGLVTNSKK